MTDEHKKGSAPKKDQNFQQELERSLLRFKAAFELFQEVKKKDYYFDVMHQELSIMDEMAKNIDRKGIRKQEVILSKDAKQFMEDQSVENQKKLQQDIVTLFEANRVPFQ